MTQKQIENRKRYRRWKRMTMENPTIRMLRKENARLRWELNEQTQFADEYHAQLTEVWTKIMEAAGQ